MLKISKQYTAMKFNIYPAFKLHNRLFDCRPSRAALCNKLIMHQVNVKYSIRSNEI